MATILPTLFTVTVTSGNQVTVTAGPTLSLATCKPGFPVVIDKQASFIDEYIDTTHFSLLTDVDNGTGLSCAISTLTSQEIKIAELNIRAAEVGEQLSAIDANGRGDFYLLSAANGTDDPGAQYFDINSLNPDDVTSFTISDGTAQDKNIANFLTEVPGEDTIVWIRSISTDAYMAIQMDGSLVPSTAFHASGAVSVLDSDGILVAGEPIMVYFDRPGTRQYSVTWDASVANDAERIASYNTSPAGWKVLVRSDGNVPPRSTLWEKISATAGDWEGPVYVTGAQGPGGTQVALGDEYTVIVSGTSKATFRQIGNMTITGVRASLKTASSSGSVEFNIKKNGVSIFTTNLTIDQGEKTSVTASIPYILNTTSLVDDNEITIDIVNAGSGAIGPKVTIYGVTPTP